MEEYSLCFAFWILLQPYLLTLLSITKSAVRSLQSEITEPCTLSPKPCLSILPLWPGSSPAWPRASPHQ
jgi:hypothetical protein